MGAYRLNRNDMNISNDKLIIFSTHSWLGTWRSILNKISSNLSDGYISCISFPVVDRSRKREN